MSWSDYLLVAAQHSKNNAQHWFRYLRKDIDKCNVAFTKEDVERLYNNTTLTLFQRVSLKAAFEEGSLTREYIINLNRKVIPNKLSTIRNKYGNMG